jgi:sterol desaturase/sphingolipid hydroxylase (fatty acid hydroxylase superfamily)
VTRATPLRIVAYPMVMSSALGASWGALALGWSPSWAIGAGAGLSALLTFFLERIIPYQHDWLEDHGDVRTDLGYALLCGPAVSVSTGILLGVIASLGVRSGMRLNVDVWPESWPMPCRLILALLVAEFVGYWLHRMQHSSEFLWRFHAPHHSSRRLYFLNGLRQHPVDSFLTTALTMSALMLLGVDPTVTALFAAYVTAHQFMQHSNVDVLLGPLNWVFGMAEVHRWHHSFRREEMDANYGAALIVWDVVFGTRRVPRDRRIEPADIVGLADDPDYPSGFVGQMLAPFQRRRSGEPGSTAYP